jgi:hypothetical protein
MSALPLSPSTDPAQEFDSAWQAYELAKAAFLAAHPHASLDEVDAGLKRIAEGMGL